MFNESFSLFHETKNFNQGIHLYWYILIKSTVSYDLKCSFIIEEKFNVSVVR